METIIGVTMLIVAIPNALGILSYLYGIGFLEGFLVGLAFTGFIGWILVAVYLIN